ncbi:MAG: DUF2336 domain-containing protein [Alphaproteobacteria bacterium]|nr:DUF2336 domain-containing protein [Alphaproteobacteria bacterium]
MSLDPENLAKADPVAKVVLAKRASRFLNSDNQAEDELATVENIARALAQDICLEVRETLAFELRFCESLPYDLAARIATDVESVSGPFIEVTKAITDDQWAALVPHLEEHAQMRLAKRADLGEHTAFAIANSSPKSPAGMMIKNVSIRLSERVCGRTMDRFGEEADMMEALSRREDLPLRVVERIVDMVSGECRKLLMEKYPVAFEVADKVAQTSADEVLWGKIAKAGPAQVHGYVLDLKREGRLNEALVIKMAGRGSFQFLGSALAIEAGITLGDVRRVIETGDLRRMLQLVHRAGFSKDAAMKIMRILKKNELRFARSEGASMH